ncbi:MAG: hypothetical protein LBM12_03445 [Candidatus Nomurabacteria bacterium]|jgi:uncharacterized membrane protein|nr:hypothetical protein [Candidatus Nomurabacteria bacterium]
MSWFFEMFFHSGILAGVVGVITLACIVLLLILVGILLAMPIQALYRALAYRHKDVKKQAYIRSKSYRPSYTTLMPTRIGNVTTLLPIIHPSQHNVQVEAKDDGAIYWIDNAELYTKSSEGESLNIIVRVYYNKAGQIKHSKILSYEV